jgi:hypothetical protein
MFWPEDCSPHSPKCLSDIHLNIITISTPGDRHPIKNYSSIFYFFLYVVKLFVCLTTLLVTETRQTVISLMDLASIW